jgi:hypothetical protein
LGKGRVGISADTPDSDLPISGATLHATSELIDTDTGYQILSDVTGDRTSVQNTPEHLTI